MNAFDPRLRKLRQVNSVSSSQPGLHNKSQASQGYLVRPFLKETKTLHKKKQICCVILPQWTRMLSPVQCTCLTILIFCMELYLLPSCGWRDKFRGTECSHLDLVVPSWSRCWVSGHFVCVELTLQICLWSFPSEFILPDVNYKVELPEENQSQNAQGPVLLLFLFVDFQSGVPVHQGEIWGMCRKMQQPDWVCQALKHKERAT